MTNSVGVVLWLLVGAVSQISRGFLVREHDRVNGSPHTDIIFFHVAPRVVILSHGFVGSSNDLTYLKDAIVREAGSGIQTQTIAFCSPCNEGKTTDGVQAGGERLAADIYRFLTSELGNLGGEGKVELTLVGNSLGGLYAR